MRTEYIYLYESGSSDPVACRSFERAVHQMLSDQGLSSFRAFLDQLEEWGVYYEYTPGVESFYCDDGPTISKIELI